MRRPHLFSKNSSICREHMVSSTLCRTEGLRFVLWPRRLIKTEHAKPTCVKCNSHIVLTVIIFSLHFIMLKLTQLSFRKICWYGWNTLWMQFYIILWFKNRLGTKPQFKSTKFSFLFEMITWTVFDKNNIYKNNLIKIKWKEQVRGTCTTLFFACKWQKGLYFTQVYHFSTLC